MSRFAPVYLSDEQALNGRVSQTMLRHFNGCPRAAYLYATTRGFGQTVEMVRGSAYHAVKQRAVEAMIANGEALIPPEVVKAIVNEVLAEFPVPFEEHDYMREMAYRWAGEWTVDPAQVVCVERLIVLKVGEWDVRCKVDFAETRSEGRVLYVADYKTARGAPGFEEIARKRKADGSWAAKSFQLILYALALAYGHPVRRVLCPTCQGTCEVGELQSNGFYESCSDCLSGKVDVVEPFPLGAGVERFDLEFVYPGIEDGEGLMLRRPVSLTQLELHEYRESLVAKLAQLGEAERTGDWPAVVSDAACGECPAKLSCPIPVELRDYRGKINTLEEAMESAEVLDRRKDKDDALRRELKAFSKARGVNIPVGDDREWAFEVRPVEETRDKEGMWAAIDRATQYGEPFERSEFVVKRTSTNFVLRKRAVEDGQEAAA